VARLAPPVRLASTAEEYAAQIVALLKEGHTGPSRERAQAMVIEGWEHKVAEMERIVCLALAENKGDDEALVTLPELKQRQLRQVRTWKGRHSELLEYRSSGAGAETVVVKRLIRWKDAENAERSILNEAATLRRIATLNGRLRESVPLVIAALPVAKTLVLHKLPGTPLSQILKIKGNWLAGRLYERQLCGMARQAGEWLRLFHNATDEGKMAFDAGAYLAVFEMRLERCKAYGAGGHGLEKLKSAAERASRRVHGASMTAAMRQGDYLPQNLLVNGSRIAVVDFENAAERDAVYEDLGTFLAYIALLRASPFYSARLLQRMGVRFSEGYGDISDPALLDLYVAKAAVTIFSEFMRHPGAGTRTWRRRRVEAELRRIAERLEGSMVAEASPQGAGLREGV
jgi:hypothetical protein